MASEYSTVRPSDLWTAVPTSNLGEELYENVDGLSFTSALLVPSDPPTTADWNTYRPTITRLYVEEKRTLKETMQIMERDHQFIATERMFKRRLADWGLRKYQVRKTSSPAEDQSRSLNPPVVETTDRKSSTRRRTSNAGQHRHPVPYFRRTPSNPESTDSFDDVDTPPSSDQDSASSSGVVNRSQDTSPVPRNNKSLSKRSPRTRADLTQVLERYEQSSTTRHDDELEKYLSRTQPNLSLTKFRTISRDLMVVESVLELIHQYYDSFTDLQWRRTFPSSPRTVMKEMTLCIDIRQSFPSGADMPIHPTQLFSRYTVAFELLKSRKLQDQEEGWRLVHEAFELFKPILQQQHTQLLRYFFQQLTDYRLDVHPEIRKRIFDLASRMSTVVLGPQHPITLICRMLPKIEDKHEICILAWRKSLELLDANIGETADDTLRSKLALAGDLIELSRFSEAENLLLRMLKTQGLDPIDYYMRSAMIRLAWLYRTQARYAEAENMLYETMRLCREAELSKDAPPDAIYIAAQTNLAQSLCSRNALEEGHKVLQAALQSCTLTYGKDHGYTTSVADELERIETKFGSLAID